MNCGDCNQSVDSRTGLACVTCRYPFCIRNCFRNHTTHKFQNLPPNQLGDDILSQVAEAGKLLTEMKFNSNSLIDFFRNFDSEIINQQLKILSVKERLKNENLQKPKHQLDSFHERHNTLLKNLAQMQSQILHQTKECYKLWGNIATY